jgi:hypothetical protein
MTMWRVKRRGRSIGALTLGGGGGRERREVAGITRALGWRGEEEIDQIDLVARWRWHEARWGRKEGDVCDAEGKARTEINYGWGQTNKI